MRDVFAHIARLVRRGEEVAAATLVECLYSRPAPIGTTLAVCADGSISGNIGAGCHEAEIVETALQALHDGGERTLELALDDELLSGSVCGARLRVAIWFPHRAHLSTLDAVAIGGEDAVLAFGSYLLSVPAKGTAIIVGATDLASSLTDQLQAVDFRVTILDPRPAFATRRRHPKADHLLVEWPEDVLQTSELRHTPVLIVSHDMKIDMPALRCAVRGNSPYIAMLGSRRAQTIRRQQLFGEGFTEQQLEALHGPAGLDLGAATNGQVALAVASEMLARLNRRSAQSLRDLSGPIHKLEALA